jgi:hypothetical protein
VRNLQQWLFDAYAGEVKRVAGNDCDGPGSLDSFRGE